MEKSEQIVRQYFKAYEAGDRQMIEQLLSNDFRFSSPYDNRIDKNLYMKICWPPHANFSHYDFKTILSDGDDVMLRYECETEHFGRLKNAEYFRLKDGMIVEIVVYFGDAAQ